MVSSLGVIPGVFRDRMTGEGMTLLSPPAKVADALVAGQRFGLVFGGRNVLGIAADEALVELQVFFDGADTAIVRSIACSGRPGGRDLLLELDRQRGFFRADE